MSQARSAVTPGKSTSGSDYNRCLFRGQWYWRQSLGIATIQCDRYCRNWLPRMVSILVGHLPLHDADCHSPKVTMKLFGDLVAT